VSSGASSPPSGGPFAPSEVVREIGARPHPVYVVRHPAGGGGGKPQLAIAERYEGAARAGNAAGEQLSREARRIATLASPNLPRVREVVTRGDDVVVFSELIEGEKLQELWQSSKLPLEISLRVIVDVLTGAGAIHNLRDAKQQPMKLAHGEISPATVVLGLDGIARLLHAIARCAPDAAPEAGSFGHLAPEVLSREPFDARADVFSAGVLLWESLSGKRLFPDAGPATAADLARRIRAGEIPPASVPEKAAWAKGLVPVAAKALAAAPDDRWPTAAALAAEIRKAAGLKLAPASTAAAFARSGIGERVKARRESLDGSAVSPSLLPAKATPSPEPPRVAPAAEPSPSPPKLDEANESVLVAPGIRAEVAEVVELESSLLVSAPDSVVPPAPSSAVGGFVLDPFAAAASLTKSPPPAPARAAPEPVHFAVADPQPISIPPSELEPDDAPSSVTGAPHFAAAIDLQQPPAPPPPPVWPAPARASAPLPPVALLPVEVAAAEEPEPFPARGARRRKALVLGGVAALGLVVFALAAIRFATRGDDAASAPAHPSVANAQPVAPGASAASAPPPAETVVSASSAAPSQAAPPAPPPVQAAPPPPPPEPAAPPPPPPPRVAPPPPAPPPPPRVVPPTPPPRPALPPAARPRPKPTFDPNSL
jgi:eukaryotic-like serine/threonine-protein kinase